MREDIPQRMAFGQCRLWAYQDTDGQVVGFGTLQECDDHGLFTNGQAHLYIPLLAVNPTIKSKGYGTAIVRHLIDEAALLALSSSSCVPELFLDVYTTNAKGITVYRNCGFVEVTAEPIPDPQEHDQTYHVMSRKVSVSSV